MSSIVTATVNGVTQIEVKNISTVLTDAVLQAGLSAVEAQVAEDVAPIWDLQPIKLTLIAANAAFSDGPWRMIVADTPAQVNQNVQNAAGDHDAEGGAPTGYVFAQVTINAGMDPNVTLSHEVLEMLGDSLIDQSMQWTDVPNPIFLAQELCDPVEDDQFAYPKNGIKVSNFVTPAYFVPGSAGPWDFRGVLDGPNTLAAGGYQLAWDPTNGWRQVNPGGGAQGRAAGDFTNRFSRRVRRRLKAQGRGVLARVSA
jgi:hypothetical protein